MDKRSIAFLVSLALAAGAFAGPGAPQRRCRFNVKALEGGIEMFLLDKNMTRAEFAKDPAWKDRLLKEGYIQSFPRCFRASWHFGSEYYRGGAGMMEKRFPEYYEIPIQLAAPQEYKLNAAGAVHCTAHGTFAENEKTEKELRPAILDLLNWLPYAGALVVALLVFSFAALTAVANPTRKSE